MSDTRNYHSERGNSFATEAKVSGVVSTVEYNYGIFGSDNRRNLYNFPRMQEIYQNGSRWLGAFRNFLKNIPGSLSSRTNSRTTSYGVYTYQHASRHDSQDSTVDRNLKTLEASLYRFDKATLLEELEKSLEEVKKNKISPEDHKRCARTADKELQRLSLKFHPDRSGNVPNPDSTEANELQSALNATRKVLKILTETFLEYISMDYKYKYFSKLDITLLVNEDEIYNKIQAVLYKISVLSEIKRMNIVGEIRNFLVASEKCVQKYFERNEDDFVMYRDYALYHLHKNIEGYKKLEEECIMLVDECSEENDEIMGSVIQNVVSKSLNESCILNEVEGVARCSFRGKFEIFPVHKEMDEYYILPFVNYINVLSMCNLAFQKSSCSCVFSHSSPAYGEESLLNNHAYYVAHGIYHKQHGIKVSYLDKILKDIFEALRIEFRLDAYKEGKSNRTEMYEELLSLKKVLEDLAEKEKAVQEFSNMYEKERQPNKRTNVAEVDTEILTNVSKELSTAVGNYRQ